MILITPKNGFMLAEQLKMTFESSSPINKEKLTGQNRRLWDWFLAGNSIHVFHPAKKELRIGYLNSRCSDLINKHGVNLYKRRIVVQDVSGEDTTVIEYSLSPFKT